MAAFRVDVTTAVSQIGPQEKKGQYKRPKNRTHVKGSEPIVWLELVGGLTVCGRDRDEMNVAKPRGKPFHADPRRFQHDESNDKRVEQDAEPQSYSKCFVSVHVGMHR